MLYARDKQDIGIGIIWLANRVEGYSLPDAYKLKKAAKGGYTGSLLFVPTPDIIII